MFVARTSKGANQQYKMLQKHRQKSAWEGGSRCVWGDVMGRQLKWIQFPGPCKPFLGEVEGRAVQTEKGTLAETQGYEREWHFCGMSRRLVY